MKCEPLKAVKPCGQSNNSSCLRSSSSWFLMYSLMTSSSRPTVDTKYPLAHICWPLKYLRLSLYTRAIHIALFPFMYPTTCDMLCFGGISISMWTRSVIICPSSTLLSFCSASPTRKTPIFGLLKHGKSNMNDTQNFWSFARRRIMNFNGCNSAVFMLHLEQSATSGTTTATTTC